MPSHNNHSEHERTIIQQFTQQAIPFVELPAHADAIDALIAMSKVNAHDTVLDVACGPGLVACEFARFAQHVTGIDITPKMIEEAQKRQQALSLNNIDWRQGSALPLPYPDNHFSMVITRYSFHHFINPRALLDEMIRVCQPKGTLLIADVALPTPHTKLYDRMEKLRDPSHVHALSQQEWEDLLQSSGLNHLQKSEYKVHLELEAQLKASFPDKNDVDEIRQIFLHDVTAQQLGIDTRMENHQIHFSYPISIFVGTK